MISQFKFNADGLIPAIVQDAVTKRVLMMAWMNEQSIRMTLEKGMMVYFSRSRQNGFTAVIQPAHKAAFDDANFDFKGLEQRRVRVRGWIEERAGLMIEVYHPAQIEVLDDGQG